MGRGLKRWRGGRLRCRCWRWCKPRGRLVRKGANTPHASAAKSNGWAANTCATAVCNDTALRNTDERWAPGRLSGGCFGAARIPGFALLTALDGGHDFSPFTALEDFFDRADTGAALANGADEVFICLRHGRPWRKAIHHFIHAGRSTEAVFRIWPAIRNTAVLNSGIVCAAKALISDAKIIVRKAIAWIDLQAADELQGTGGRVAIVQIIKGDLEKRLGVAIDGGRRNRRQFPRQRHRCIGHRGASHWCIRHWNISRRKRLRVIRQRLRSRS